MLKMKIERIKKSIRIENIAKEMNVSKQYVYQMERGNYSPDPIQAQQICNLLGVEFGVKKHSQDNSHGLSLMQEFPSTKRLEIKEYIEISRKLGYSCDPHDIFSQIK